MKDILFLSFVFVSSFLQGQIDTTYIQKIPDTKVIGIQSNLRLFQLNFSTKTAAPIHFQNYNLSLGIRFKYKLLGATIAVPVHNFRNYNLGDSKAYSVGFGIYPKSFFVQGDLRYIQGLSDFEQNIFREDMRAIYGELYTVYLFNAAEFSLRSAFKMVNRQKRSAGSWLISNILEYQHLQTDSLKLALQAQDFVLQKYHAYKFGLGGGYAYTLVWRQWAFTAMLSGGAEFRRLNYQAMENRNNRNLVRVSPRIRAFVACIYNSERFFYGFTSNYLPGLDNTEVLNTRVQNWSLRFNIGWRLH